jgi:hypothetical protein
MKYLMALDSGASGDSLPLYTAVFTYLVKVACMMQSGGCSIFGICHRVIMTTIAEKVLPQTEATPARSRRATGLLLVVLACVSIVQWKLGAFPSRIYGHDLFVFLSGAWRVASGQIPYVDFYSGLGVLVWKPVQIAFLLHGYDADAIGLARAIYTAVLGVWCLLLLRREDKLRWLFVLVFLSAARPLGEYPTWISHAMFYNRVGYALLFLVMIDQLSVSRFMALDASEFVQRQGSFLMGFSSGAALACTLLLKISYTVMGVVLLGLGLVLFGVQRRHIAGVLAGGLAVLAAAIAFLHFQPVAFLHETLTLSRERQGILGAQLVTVSVTELGGLAFTLAAGAVIATLAFANRRVMARYLLATLVIAGCDIFGRATNAMWGDLPLCAFWCLSGALLLLSLPFGAAMRQWHRYSLAALLLCPIALPLFVKDVASTLYAASQTVKTRRQATLRFDSEHLSSFVPLEWKGDNRSSIYDNGSQLILITNDGLQLLKALSGPHETISTASFVNPFPFALGRRPAEGGAVWFGPNNNVSTSHPLPVAMLIGHPDLLMVEKPIDAGVADIRAIFDAYPDLLTKDFAFVGSSEYWSLYRRRPSGSAQ